MFIGKVISFSEGAASEGFQDANCFVAPWSKSRCTEPSACGCMSNISPENGKLLPVLTGPMSCLHSCDPRMKTTSLPPKPAVAYALVLSVPLPMSPHKSTIVPVPTSTRVSPVVSLTRTTDPLLPELCVGTLPIPVGSTAKLISGPVAPVTKSHERSR